MKLRNIIITVSLIISLNTIQAGILDSAKNKLNSLKNTAAALLTTKEGYKALAKFSITAYLANTAFSCINNWRSGIFLDVLSRPEYNKKFNRLFIVSSMLYATYSLGESAKESFNKAYKQITDKQN